METPEPTLEAAILEKLFVAEKKVALIRIFVIVAGTISFLFLNPDLIHGSIAYPLLAAIWLYGGYVWLMEPYRKFPLLMASWFTYTSDALFATLWIYATGSFFSPYYVMFYTSIVAVAYRFTLRTTMLTATIYNVCYIGLLIIVGQANENLAEIIIRCSFIYILGLFAAFIVKETFDQIQAKQVMKTFNAELENKVAERTQELEHSLARFEGMIEAIPQMAWLASPDGNVTYVNNTWYEFTGGTDLSGLNLGKYIFKDDYQRTLDHWLFCVNSGSDFEIEYRWVKHDGTIHWMLGRANPIRNTKGMIDCWVGTATNIHEQKLHEQKKDDFMSIASHELKTPLTSIKAYIQLLEKKIEKEDERYRFVEKAANRVEHLNGLVSDLLDVSKIQTGKMNLNISSFDFDAMVNESIENVQHMTSDHTIHRIGLVEEIIQADKQRLEQVLNNFLTNAVKYSPKDSNIEVKVTKNNSDLIVCVTDTGIGISEKDKERLFERFFRVEGLEARFQGLGIGLYIASEIIKRHNGSVWVESELGKGSKFYFSVPIENELFKG